MILIQITEHGIHMSRHLFKILSEIEFVQIYLNDSAKRLKRWFIYRPSDGGVIPSTKDIVE